MTDEWESAYGVVVVGGGAAGLSGGLMLARSRRSVVVVDAGQPRNAPAEAVHGLFALDGTPPTELLSRGRAQLRSYGGHVVSGEVAAIASEGDGFVVTLADGRVTRARRVLVTTGLVDVLPDIPGLREGWGHDVVHCPYCHGWEVRDRAIGVLSTGPMSVHQALLFSQLSDDVVLLTHTQGAPDEEQLAQLAARGVTVQDGEVVAVEFDNDRLSGVRLADGRFLARQAVAVATRMEARAGFLADLGLLPLAHPTGMGEHIAADPMGRTEVAGVWAAGNVTDLSAQVGGAAAAAAFAAAQINYDLIMADLPRKTPSGLR